MGWRYFEVLTKKYDEKSKVGYILEVDVQYPPKKLYEFHSDLPFLPERKKLRNVGKLFTSLEDKCEYVVQIKSLKQVLNHGFVLKKVHGAINFNQSELLKPYNEMNNKLNKMNNNEQKQKKILKKTFSN